MAQEDAVAGTPDVFRRYPHSPSAHVLGNCCHLDLQSIWKGKLHHYFFRNSLIRSARRHSHMALPPLVLPLFELGWANELGTSAISYFASSADPSPPRAWVLVK